MTEEMVNKLIVEIQNVVRKNRGFISNKDMELEVDPIVFCIGDTFIEVIAYWEDFVMTRTRIGENEVDKNPLRYELLEDELLINIHKLITQYGETF